MHRITDRRLRVLIASALAIFTSWTAPAGAQATVETTPPLVLGDTVRVWAPTARLDGAIGTFARLDVNGLVIAGRPADPSLSAPQWAVPLSDIVRLDVLRARQRSARRIVTGMVVGIAAGALVGAPLGPLIECGGACDKTGSLQPKVGSGIGATFGGVIGGIIGGVIGGASRPRWQSVSFTVR